MGLTGCDVNWWWEALTRHRRREEIHPKFQLALWDAWVGWVHEGPVLHMFGDKGHSLMQHVKGQTFP